MQKHIHAEDFTITEGLNNLIDSKISEFEQTFSKLSSVINLHINLAHNKKDSDFTVKLVCECSKIRHNNLVFHETDVNIDHAINVVFKNLYIKFNEEKELLNNR